MRRQEALLLLDGDSTHADRASEEKLPFDLALAGLPTDAQDTLRSGMEAYQAAVLAIPPLPALAWTWRRSRCWIPLPPWPRRWPRSSRRRSPPLAHRRQQAGPAPGVLFALTLRWLPVC